MVVGGRGKRVEAVAGLEESELRGDRDVQKHKEERDQEGMRGSVRDEP